MLYKNHRRKKKETFVSVGAWQEAEASSETRSTQNFVAQRRLYFQGLVCLVSKLRRACWRSILGGTSNFHGSDLVGVKFQNEFMSKLVAHNLSTSKDEGFPQFRCCHLLPYRQWRCIQANINSKYQNCTSHLTEKELDHSRTTQSQCPFYLRQRTRAVEADRFELK